MTENEVSRPAHYTQGGIEPIDLIMSQDMNGLQANVVKYVTRYKHKRGTEDLKKAIQYLIWLYIQELFKKQETNWTVNTPLKDGTLMNEFALELIRQIDKRMERLE